jgi:hypothetical protein
MDVNKDDEETKVSEPVPSLLISKELLTQIKLTKKQINELKKLENMKNGDVRVKKERTPAQLLYIKNKQEKAKAAKEAKEAAEKAIQERKEKYIEIPIPPKKVKPKKQVVIEVTDDDTNNTEETDDDIKPPRTVRRRQRFQKDKVELDTSDEERIQKIETLEKVINQFAFAPRRRRF